MRDLVSVLLPYKDVDATLEEAIASLLSERDARLELLAIDDGSRDASAAIARRLANRDQRVRLLASEGRGLVAALELGRREAQGAWIARMDGDDVAMPGRLQFQLSFMKERPEVVALGTRVEAFPSEAVGEG
ncbi:MAG: glycosyltransferase, partial [Sandaracinaceae bacterium]|nr:glycosyltransferase [Sandaracinaceae bacterium]